MADRIISEDRIKNITISAIVSRKENDDFVKITKARMIEAIAKSIAERLFMFDKVLVKEIEKGVVKHDAVLLNVSFDIIVPKGRQE